MKVLNVNNDYIAVPDISEYIVIACPTVFWYTMS